MRLSGFEKVSVFRCDRMHAKEAVFLRQEGRHLLSKVDALVTQAVNRLCCLPANHGGALIVSAARALSDDGIGALPLPQNGAIRGLDGFCKPRKAV